MSVAEQDERWMAVACEAGRRHRLVAPPNPWVGAVVVTDDGDAFVGATGRPGEPHAEPAALARAGAAARGATLHVTLEPCAHHGRTPPCVDAVVEAGIRRVVVGVVDPDERVGGSGVERLRAAGVEVEVGVLADTVEHDLASYLHHRRTGRPWVTLKLASSLDGRTAAPDGTSQWITGPEARADVHRLRAEHDAIVVGAGTVRDDDPLLTVRDVTAADGRPPRQPLRVVLGAAPPEARVRPCREESGPPVEILDRLGADGVTSVLIEGGAAVAGQWHRSGVVDAYVVYFAPALFGGDDGRPVLAGPGASSIDDVWRGRIDRLVTLGDDVRVDLRPRRR